MKIGFIGLGNVGGKLAGSLIRNGHDVTVRDLDDSLVSEYVARGATSAASPKVLGEAVENRLPTRPLHLDGVCVFRVERLVWERDHAQIPHADERVE